MFHARLLIPRTLTAAVLAALAMLASVAAVAADGGTIYPH